MRLPRSISLIALSWAVLGVQAQARPAPAHHAGAGQEKGQENGLKAGHGVGAPFHIDVLQLESDPPEKVRSAPGGGRTLAPALLYTPAKGANPYGPAIVILDNGPGSHPLGHDQAARFMAESLASAGYTVLSPYTGQERNFPTVPFADNRWAVKNAIDYLEHAGYEDIVLAGQGYGAMVAADYLKALPDKSLDNGPERRVKALILLNPALQPSGYPGFGPTTDLAAREALARKEVADGTGLFPAALEPGHNVARQQADWILQGRYSMPAEGWLQYWGSEARARNSALVRGLPVPTLVVSGAGAAMAPADEVKALAGPHSDVILLPGATNDLSGQAATVNGRVASWLAAHDLAPRPAVRTHATDLTLADGTQLYGLVYEPATPVPANRPVLVLISGRTGDTLESSTQWMGWRFAQQGYRVLAPSNRISGVTGVQTETMAHTREDIGHWIDGFAGPRQRVVLLGHSNGGIWISDYVATTHDPRVAGMIYVAPTVDAQTYKRKQVGDAEYERLDAAAYRARAEGHPDTMFGLESAVAFSELYGSKAGTEHSQRVREFTLPGIAFAGGKDPLMSDWFLDRFTHAYRGKLELVRYPDGTHGFRESKDRLTNDAVRWLHATFP